MKTESITALSDTFSSRESSGFLNRLFLKKVDLEEHALLLEVALAELEDSFLRQKKVLPLDSALKYQRNWSLRPQPHQYFSVLRGSLERHLPEQRLAHCRGLLTQVRL